MVKYNKKYYYNKKKKSKLWKILKWILVSYIVLVLFSLFYEKNPYLFQIFIKILLFSFFIFLIYFFIKNWIKLWSKINNIYYNLRKNKLLPSKVKDIKKKIESFKPLRNYSKEEPYQIELSWYLKNFFPSLDIEISKNYTRPDILIEDIAIEIKWPTNFSDLKTIPDKIIRYTKEWDYLIIVLFNLKLHDDFKKSDEIYENWKKDIEESFDSKLDRIMFIKI